MKKTTALFFTLILSLLLISGCLNTNDSNGTTGTKNIDNVNSEGVGADSSSESLVYELRTYTTHDGKLDDLHTRFENHTMELFEKHGMTNIMYWSPQDPDLSENTLIYLLSHESREAAEESWNGFVNDEEWQQVYEASRVDGPIVERVESVFMTKTPYSP
jgi:hypothetical protein